MARAICLGAAALALSLGLATAQESRPFGGFKHDSSEPIEVTSETLEVREAESIAIFTGSVKAGQGTLRLEADRVVVAFDQDARDSETGAIRNMKAEGDVFLSNGAETAEGRFAEYDVETGKMFMRGDVVLTQGANVIAGEVLEIDLNTGVANMVGQRTAAAEAEDGGEGRVRMRFVPAARGEGE